MDAAHLTHFPAGEADYTISEAEHESLWRAHHAVTLLAALNNDMAFMAGVTPDSTAAVADYVREALLDVVLHAQRIRPPADDESPQRSSDLI